MSTHLAHYRHARADHPHAPALVAVPAYFGGVAFGTGLRVSWQFGERLARVASRTGRSVLRPPAGVRRRVQAAGPVDTVPVVASRRDSISVRRAA